MTIYNHLPVNPEITRAVLDNPEVTYDDLESLYWSITNCEAMGGWSSLFLNEINERQADMVLRDLWKADE